MVTVADAPLQVYTPTRLVASSYTCACGAFLTITCAGIWDLCTADVIYHHISRHTVIHMQGIKLFPYYMKQHTTLKALSWILEIFCEVYNGKVPFLRHTWP